MNYISTRGKAPILDFTNAMLTGLASDGGLYVANKYPKFSANDIAAFADLSYADLAICSFGMTAYELAYCSVRTLYICISEDHNESAKTFEKSGFGENLGNYKELSENKLKFKINQFVNNFLKNKKFVKFSSDNKIDGLAAKRISEILINAYREKSRA